MNFENIDFTQRKQEQTTTTTTEKTVTRKQYQEAVKKALEQAAKDDKLEGMASLMYGLSGACFAADIEKILFGESEG